MKDWIKSEAIYWLAAVFFLAAVGVAVGAFAAINCHQSWDQSGMRVEWRPFAGCMLERTTGIWIPARNYREVP